MRLSLLSVLLLSLCPVRAQRLTFVELNCENLFDCQHDEGNDDQDFTPEGSRRWTHTRYWNKVNGVAQALLACSQQLPDVVALIEVENDSVLRDLTARSLLRQAGYHYVMTHSADVRGIDVALLYQPQRFKLIEHTAIAIEPMRNQRPTRDLLLVKGRVLSGDTLHLIVVHAPSRSGGELETKGYRKHVAQRLLQTIDSIGGGSVVVAGDFNDYADSPSLQLLGSQLRNVTAQAQGSHGAKGTYRFKGDWHSLDHVLLSPSLLSHLDSAYICDAPFLLEKDKKYGGVKPRRTFNGFRYEGGTSDHLPLVVCLVF